MIKINGETVDDVEGLSLAVFLAREKYALLHVAVECNCEIVPKTQYESKKLTDGDVLEIVCFVGGG